MSSRKESNKPAEAEIERPASADIRKPASRAREADFCVYIGPSVRGRALYGTVYPSMQSARQALAKELAACPALSLFLVTGNELPQARVEAGTPGTVRYIQAGKVREELKKL